MSVWIAPSILSADFAHMGAAVTQLTAAGADVIHVDVMDGHFVPNLTFGPPMVAAIRKYTAVPLDVHLMIEAPDRSLAAYRDAGADIITVHAEACTHLQRTLAAIRETGAKAGVALCPATAPAFLEYIIDDVDLILVMTVNPGFGGQSFLPAMLHKITSVRRMCEERGYSQTRIEVDGGITPETARVCVAAGADVLVAGSYVFSAPSLEEGIRGLQNA